MYYLNLDGFQIVGAAIETVVTVHGGKAATLGSYTSLCGLCVLCAFVLNLTSCDFALTHSQCYLGLHMTRFALLLCLALATMASSRETKPNIIFFIVDDYDKPETSVYGGKVLTPTLDRMAREGMTFHNVHMTSTVCTPSRYTCLTGRRMGSFSARAIHGAYRYSMPISG